MNTTIRYGRERRQFLKLCAVAGGGLVLGFSPVVKSSERASSNHWRPSAWLQIDVDGRVTIMLTESEMGQGVLTSMPMLVAEELEVDWKHVRVQQAPVDPAYGWQGTGGSRSVREAWKPLREVGATAREMLIAAAAKRWRVPRTQCQARNSSVFHAISGRRITYGDLVATAARMSLPKTVKLKGPSEFRIIGKSVPRLDTPAKVNGSARFGMDVRVPNQLTATIMHCPVFGGKAKRVDTEAALAIKGVHQVLNLDAGVAVVADNFWLAYKGQQALTVEWDLGPNAKESSASLSERLHALANVPATRVRTSGDIPTAMHAANRIIESLYETPLQAHATMEPMCCTADVRKDGCTIWVPTQQPTGVQQAVARLLLEGGEPNPEDLQRIVVHTTLLGGGFGRRNLHDFVIEAVQISRSMQRPIQLIWTRAEDLQHDFYHPATAHHLKAGIDHLGMPLAWEHRIMGSPYAAGAEDLPYSVPNIQVETAKIKSAVPVGPWRSVAHAYNAFAVECFIDELAAAANRDALDYRLALLEKAPRHRAVLELASNKSGWGHPRQGHYQGVALHASFGSIVAQVVEISINELNQLRVHRVTCAVDCGIAINPDGVAAQMEGSVAFGLTAALKGQITIHNGRVEQSNFHDYPLLRIDEMPQVDTFILPSTAEPGGIGEPGVPPVAPALLNAVYAATGRRQRRLPYIPKSLD